MFLKYAKAKCESEIQKYVKLKKNKKTNNTSCFATYK